MSPKRSLIKRIGDAVDHWIIQGTDNGSEPLDTMVKVVTPENIAFDYRVAGPFRRVLAFALDVLLYLFFFFCITILTSLIFAFVISPFCDSIGAPEVAEALSSISGFLLIVGAFFGYWFYGAILETYMNGQTIAKRILSLRVLTTDGRPINGLQATVRTLLRYAEGLPFISLQVVVNWLPYLRDEFDLTNSDLLPLPILSTFLTGLVIMSLTPRFQRLGDLFCGTMVVHEQQHWFRGVEKIDDPRAPRLAELIPPTFVVSREMAGALATYVERRRYFSPERRREIARHLAQPLILQFGMLQDTSYDLLLCAMYYRTFDQQESGEPAFNPLSARRRKAPQQDTPVDGPTPANSDTGDIAPTTFP